MSKNKNVLQKGSALDEGEAAWGTREGFLQLFLQIQKVSFFMSSVVFTNKKVSNYFPQSLTLAEGEAAWCAREGSHRQSGCVGQRRRDTGEGYIDNIEEKTMMCKYCDCCD